MGCIGKGDTTVRALIIAKTKGILCGIDVAKLVFRTLDEDIEFDAAKDGNELIPNQRVTKIKGSARAVLYGERVALNFLTHLSGIATLTRRFVEEIEGTGVRLLDTRKTTPLLRGLEKYAVKVGGGESHRCGLYDAILVKDNHLKIVGGIENLNIDRSFEVEVKNLDEFRTALKLPNVKRIMLDNMDIEDIKKAVEIRDRLPVTGYRLPELEVSGGVKIENIREIAKTGVQYISVGAITHSAPVVDMSLEIAGKREERREKREKR
jgi:nicotinate-nucleotide pyrophosphorylase (carboxylating)